MLVDDREIKEIEGFLDKRISDSSSRCRLMLIIYEKMSEGPKKAAK